MAKRQHWVPRFYLRYFATPESLEGKPGREQAWILHRSRDEDAILANISNFAAAKHLYSSLKTDGSRDLDFEAMLSGLEGTVSQAWPSLTTSFVDLKNIHLRRILALFIALQTLRHPAMRDTLKSWNLELAQLLARQPELQDRLGREEVEISFETQKIVLTPSDWEGIHAEGNDWMTKVWTASMRGIAVDIATYLVEEKRWSTATFDVPALATSDHPVNVIDPGYERWQVQAPNANIVFPISPTRAILIDSLPGPGFQHYRPPPEQASFTTTWPGSVQTGTLSAIVLASRC